MYSFSYLELVCCSVSRLNCCFLTCIQVPQEACQVVWYSHLFQNFPQFIVIHKVKDFGIVSKAEIDVFLELSCFFHDPAEVAIWSLVPLPFLKPAWTSGSSRFAYCWNLAWRAYMHHEKCWDGRSTSWNQDFWDKYTSDMQMTPPWWQKMKRN